MLTIRREQLEALAEARKRDFERRVRVHLEETQPELHDELGEETVRASIQWGIERALGHGLESEYDIARYIDAMYALGPEFDADPELPPRARMDVIGWRIEELLERPEGDG